MRVNWGRDTGVIAIHEENVFAKQIVPIGVHLLYYPDPDHANLAGRAKVGTGHVCACTCILPQERCHCPTFHREEFAVLACYLVSV